MLTNYFYKYHGFRKLQNLNDQDKYVIDIRNIINKLIQNSQKLKIHYNSLISNSLPVEEETVKFLNSMPYIFTSYITHDPT